MPVTYEGIVPDSPLDPVGEFYLKVDNSTITALSYSPVHFRAMGDMYFNGSLWEYCPRFFLKNMVNYASKMGINIKASFENEFYLLNNERSSPESTDKLHLHLF